MHGFTALRELTISQRGITVKHGAYALLPPVAPNVSIIDPSPAFLEPLLTGIREHPNSIRKLTFIFSADSTTTAASFNIPAFEEALRWSGIVFDKVDM